MLSWIALLKPSLHILNLALEKRIFQDDLKIAWVTPIFKTSGESKMENCRPISVLPCLSKILELIIYSRHFKYLIANEIFYKNNLILEKDTQLNPK